MTQLTIFVFCDVIWTSFHNFFIMFWMSVNYYYSHKEAGRWKTYKKKIIILLISNSNIQEVRLEHHKMIASACKTFSLTMNFSNEGIS